MLKIFNDNFQKYRTQDIICIGKTPLNSFTIRKKDRLKIKTCCVIKTNNQQIFKKYTGIFVIFSS